MQEYLSVKLKRHNPLFQFGFDELEIDMTTSTDDLADDIMHVRSVMDALMPATPETIGAPHDLSNPTPAPTPWTPPDTIQTPTPLYDPNAQPWVAAELTISPCGVSKGTPLGRCDDKDLEYISTSYKKDPNIRAAAGVVLGARRMGQTTQKP